ncbi:hypothetical protein [Mesorhizobium sp. LjNodule214]|uniref:hypothetical protein n=1 Tax=Mesorhizobium sp. LjNodule214 TaxID=3342252 RepID=UPI003ECC3A14
MNQPMTLREEQESAIREAAERLAERFNQAFNFDPQKLEDFRTSKSDRQVRQQQASKNL